MDLSEDGHGNIGHRSMSAGPITGSKRLPTQQQVKQGHPRPRANQENFFTGVRTDPTVESHRRPIQLPNGKCSTDRDIFCHGHCEEKMVFAHFDVTLNGMTYPLCHMCCDLHGLEFEGRANLGEVSEDYIPMTVEQGPLATDIEVKGCIDELRMMVADMKITVMN